MASKLKELLNHFYWSSKFSDLNIQNYIFIWNKGYLGYLPILQIII